MTVNISQKFNAVWFLGLGIYNHYSGKGVEALMLNLIALICWHILFADKAKK